jgi:thiamine biosynthesis lipoprotein
MNTDIELRTVDPVCAPQVSDAARSFQQVEWRFSRFRADSELSALNARTSATVPVSAQMVDLLDVAMRMHGLTGGVFDPSILPELEVAGYDRSFELVPAARVCAPSALPARGFDAIDFDRRAGTVTLPPGLRVDFGGIGKGWAVDRAVEIPPPSRIPPPAKR